jgi:hypothetical protein
MKIAAIPVAHTQYRVQFTKKKPRVGKDVCQGYCDYKRRLIVVWENPNALAMRSCLIHEWLHALFYELGHEGLADDHGIIVAIEMALMRLRLEVPSL